MTDPFLLTASTLPIAFTSDGTHAVPAPLWTAPTALQRPVIRQILIQNPIGNPIFYIAVGKSTMAAATSANLQIYPGMVLSFSVNEQNNYFSALSASGTATMTVTPGFGD